MPRFYCAMPLATGLTVDLPLDVAHHIQVLRLAAGAQIQLFNGEGGEYTAHITAKDKKRVSVTIGDFSGRETELPYALTLAQALPEAAKMDWIIEKAVELGVHAIQPLATQRCVVRLNAERAEKRLGHWQGVVTAASEQCGRNRLAQVALPQDFRQWISQQDLHRRLVLSPRAETSLSYWARHQPPQALTVVIGPEGGLTEQEEDLAQEHGALLFSMGPRILRTETAGLAAVAALNALWGEL